MTRRVARGAAIFLFVVLVIGLSLVGPVDRTPLEQTMFYREMSAALDTVDLNQQSTMSGVQVGWQMVNITPAAAMPMAGYTPRDHFDTVHDSLYARILAVRNNQRSCVFISLDLLLFPRMLKERLIRQLEEYGCDASFLYLSATHTHNGVGGWDNSVLGGFAVGEYHGGWIDTVARRVATAICQLDAKPSLISYFESDATEYVENRISADGKADGKVRGIQILRDDSTRAVLYSFSAHATSISKESRELSADYPGETERQLMGNFDFVMFMAGMVGSHRFHYYDEKDYKLTVKLGGALKEKILQAIPAPALDSVTIKARHIPVAFGPSQFRVTSGWRVRDWVFSAAAGDLQGELTYVAINDIVFIGTPCDFSGEIYVSQGLEDYAARADRHLVITSFNGDYVGYITDDVHYDSSSHEEVTSMNWVGPHFGIYFSWMLKKLLDEEKKLNR